MAVASINELDLLKQFAEEHCKTTFTWSVDCGGFRHTTNERHANWMFQIYPIKQVIGE